VNNVRVADADAVPAPEDWLPGGWLAVRKGRRSVVGVHCAAAGRTP
jgi:tyrosyl-tRNA synthetase